MKERLSKVTKYLLLSLLLCILVLVTGQTDAFAAADGDEFTSGGLKYEILSTSDKTVTITGYTSVSGNLSIPANVSYEGVSYAVKEIAYHAFQNCNTISKVTLPSSLTLLEAKSFEGSSVTEVNIPKLMEADDDLYGNGPFTNCSKLTTVTFETGITKIPNRLFASCTGLKSITIPASVLTVGEGAFSKCTSLSQVSMGNNIKTIEGRAFIECTALQSVTLPSALNSLGAESFASTGLTSITIPKTVTSCDDNIFSHYGPFGNCTKLTSVTIANGMTTLPEHIFSYCTGLKEITLPLSVVKIGSDAFSDCTNLTSCTMTNNVVEIGAGVFRGCTSLKQITLSNRLKSIGYYVFKDSGVTSITIPNSLEDCDTELYGYGPFAASSITEIKLEAGRTEIPNNLLSGCTSVKTFTIPSTIKKIGNGAFKKSGLTSITIPATVVEIGDGVFQQSEALESINIQAEISKIPDAFAQYCTNLKKVTFPTKNYITEINGYAFRGCASLTSITLPANLSSIGNCAFAECTSLTAMTLPSQVREIGYALFSGCENLKTVTLSAGLTVIPRETFKGCGSLTSADIPYRVTKIDPVAFDTCYSLTNIAIPKSVESIADDVFSYPGSMTINGISGSYAQTFANTNDIAFTTNTVATKSITLHNSNLLKLGVPSSEFSTEVGKKYSVIAALTPVSSTQGVTWTSSNTKVAIVDADGVVEAVGGGKAVITAKSGSVSASYTLNVKVPLTGLKLDKSSITFNAVGGYTTLKATKTPTNTSESVTWTSSNTKVATVDANGKVVAKGVGTAVITACGNESSSVKATCNITVKNISLATPSIKVESADYDKLKISWGKVSNATGYQIYRYDSKKKQFEKIKDITSGTTVSYTNTGLDGYEYKYKVKAVMTSYNKTVYSALSAQKSATPKPKQVTGVKQSAYTSTSISLKWTKQTGVTGYQVVKCSSANGTYSSVKTLTSNTTSYTNTGCKSGTSYYYKVRAYKTNGSGTKVYGAYSSPVKMTTKPGVTTVSLSKASSTSIKVTWTKTKGSESYEVYMSTSKNGTYSKIKTVKSGSSLSYTKTGLTKGKTYYFKVRSYKTDASGAKVYSGWSEIKSKSL